MKQLAFKMRRSVIYVENEDSLTLILRYPLKALILKPFWKPVFSLLSNGSYISLERIQKVTGRTSSDKIDSFLTDLVCKGFLEREGFLELEQPPFVSVIIPVRNRPAEIEKCLKSLLQLEYPADRLEIIVVDDASTDQTSAVIKRFPVKLITMNDNQKAPFCRNLASRKAEGDILAFIDSDCLASPLWLKELLPAFQDPAIAAVGGFVDSCFTRKPLDRYEKVKSSLFMGQGYRCSNNSDHFFYTPSCNMLVRKNVFLGLNGFNEKLVVGEDVDFCWRMQDQEHRLSYRPAGKIFHKHRNKVKSFCSRRFDYGTSEPLLQGLHRNRTKTMVLPPGATLFWTVLILTAISTWAPLALFSLVPLFGDAVGKRYKIRQVPFPLGFLKVLLSVFRSYLAFFYHSCAFISRYHLIWLIPAVMIFPVASAVIVSAHLLTGIVEYLLKKPALNPLIFLVYFTLEQLSYQLGVWKGCFQNSCFSPVFPRLAVKSGFFMTKSSFLRS